MSARRTLSCVGALAIVLTITPMLGQVGSNNPTGVAGSFGPEITTGCEYSPYTGNAKRSIVDINVAGAVGTIPLALGRIYNSRGTSDWRFGVAGNWSHSYAWSISDSDESTSSILPYSYRVNFPDGRAETLSYSSSDVYFRGAVGLPERFIQFTGNPLLGYLVLADGSKVEFKATSKSYIDGDTGVRWYYYTFTAQALIDPYGARTSLTYNTDGTLQKVTEPAGRYLQFYYATIGGKKVIDHVAGSDGRTVQYYYIQSVFSPGTIVYVCLDHVVYFGNAQWTATYRYKAPNVGTASGVPLLWKCDDPMYEGPMKRIAYTYRTSANLDGSLAVYGQIQSENYYDGTSVGAAVSTLSVGASNPSNSNIRTETRGDGKSRTFTYTGYNLVRSTDFLAVIGSQTYDAWGFVNSITDRNQHTTNFAINWVNGALLRATFPGTPGDTPANTLPGVVSTTYGNASCADPNNRDSWNPYYVCTSTDEGGHVTQFTRDINKRVTRIDYPDGGYETFSYNSFGQVLTHRLKTGGTESFTYDGTGTKLTYRDPYHASGNPSAWYDYDAMNRVSKVIDALGSGLTDADHTTSFVYDDHNQLLKTTLPKDPVNNMRNFITNAYNPDGTLQSKTDERGYVTSYTYDDYRRLKSVTTPQRAPGDNTPRTTYFYYDANGTTDDYRYADTNVTFVVLPSGKKTKAVYDDNRRKSSVTVGFGTSEAATTSYGYDNLVNVTSMVAPNEQTGQAYAGKRTVTIYDERDRPMSITDALLKTTTFMYDAAGRQSKVTRPNGQTITYDSYDAGNRLLQQTVKQTPGPDAVTKYTYYVPADGANAAVGLLKNMKDPYLVVTSSTYSYGYTYDLMGRKIGASYPPGSGSATSEAWHYDIAGRNDTFTNRQGKTQTLAYDALNRVTQSSWDDSGVTPTVTYGYDTASRLLTIDNVNSNITRAYYNDNLLKSETQAVAGGASKTMTYTYNEDGNRLSMQYPGSYLFNYTYTGRNQLQTVGASSSNVTYAYDVNGNLATRTLLNSTSSSYTVDALDRLTHITHSLVGTTRTFDYDYDSVSNRKWTKRDGGTGDVFGYDLNDQVNAVKLNIANPDTTVVGTPTIVYDANGNRTSFSAYGPTDNYTVNNLSQYSARNSNNAMYDPKGNMTTGLDNSTYSYDAQNRLLNKGTTQMVFKYDGLNRQVTRTVPGSTTYNVYDGWDLIEECDSNGAIQALHLYGAGEPVFTGSNQGSTYWKYYYQNGEGSTSHIASTAGALLEWYRYDLQGTPFFYDGSNNSISASAFGIRHLFTGQQWYKEIGLYDLRNRFYSPDIGRFLQPDPIGFDGDTTNLYRYCGNNPINGSDPEGTTVTFGRGSDTGAINKAIYYLEGSPAFSAIYSALWNSSNTYTITTNYSFTNGGFRQGSAGGTIVWNPNGWALLSNGAMQSPPMVLAHELAGHGYDYEQKGLTQFLQDADRNDPTAPSGYDTWEEYDAVHTEAKIGNELGENTRSDHRGVIIPLGPGFQLAGGTWTSGSAGYYSWRGPTFTGSAIPTYGTAAFGRLPNGYLGSLGGPFDPGSSSFNVDAWLASYGIGWTVNYPGRASGGAIVAMRQFSGFQEL